MFEHAPELDTYIGLGLGIVHFSYCFVFNPILFQCFLFDVDMSFSYCSTMMAFRLVVII